MKKRLIVILAVILAFVLVLASCDNFGANLGNKKVTRIEIVQGTLKYEYELNEVPDFSGVEAKIKYNDETEKSVTGADLKFGTIDTSKPGIQTLTITYDGYTLEVDVKVLAGNIDGGNEDDKPVVTGISATIANESATIFKGTAFDTSVIKVNALYSDSTAVALTEGVTFSTVDTSTVGKKTITVTYGEFTDTVEIEVVYIESMVVVPGTISNKVMKGETLSVNTLQVNVTFTNSKTKVVSIYDNDVNKLTVGTIDTSTIGDKELSIAYRGFEIKHTVHVKGITALKVTPGSVNTSTKVGTALDVSKLTATATYSDKEEVLVSNDKLGITNVDVTSAGKKLLTVTYEAVTTNVEITVVGVKTMTVVSDSIKNSILVGESYSAENVKINVVFTDDTTDVVEYSEITVNGTVNNETAGTSTLTFAYLDGTVEYNVNVYGITGIAIETEDGATTLPAGFEPDLAKFTVFAVYGNGARVKVTEGITTNKDTLNWDLDEDKELKFFYNTFEASVTISVNEPTLENIEISAYTNKIGIGKVYDKSAVTVTASYSNNTTKTVTASDLTISDVDTSVAGTKTLTVSYKGKEATANVEVLAISSMSISGVASLINVNEALDLSNLKLTVTYNDSSVEVLTSGFEVGSFDVTVGGNQTLTVTYMGRTATANVHVKALQSVKIVGGYATKAYLGQPYDLNSIKLTLIYTNGDETEITTGFEFTSVVNTNNVGTQNLTVTYAGFSDSVEVEVLGISKVEAIGAPDKVNQGDTLDTENITLLVTFSDNTTATITSDKLTFGEFNTSSYGDKDFTVSYMGNSATVKIHVKGVTSITVVTGTLTNALYTTDTFTTEGALINVTYSDGTIKENVADAIFGDIDTTTEGDKNLTVTYDGFTINVTIIVKKIVVGSTIFGVNLPSNISSLDSYKGQYKNKDSVYVVGDDNAYTFKLSLVVLNENDEKVSTAVNYTSYSLVYLVNGATETLLEGAELAKYVSVDETKNAFDFTEEAIGLTFKIATRPSSNFLPGQEAQMTRTHTVKVVDGYNIYSAKELNIITNDDDTYGESGNKYNQLDEVNKFLSDNNITRPENLAAVVLHDNFIIKESDLPDSYVQEYTNASGVTKKGLYDLLSVYRHKVTAEAPTFSIYGNYYTLSSYSIPNVGEQGYLNNEDHLSNSQLFMFTVDESLYENEKAETYNPNDYATNVYDLTLRDNDPNSNVTEDSQRHLLGVIGVKTRLHTVNYTNSRIEAYFISFMTDSDHQIINLNQVDFYNAWQGHIFTFGHNMIAEDNDTQGLPPAENYYPTKINITDSRLAKCGGPVFLSQTKLHNGTYVTERIPANAKSKTDIEVDDKSVIYSYVTGTEAWFVAFGQTALATQIQLMSQGFANLSQNTVGYTSTNLIEGGHSAMNLIMVNMDASAGLTLNPTISPDKIEDIDGSLIIGGQNAMNMNNDYTGSVFVNTYINNVYAVKGQIPPIFQTSAGGTCAFNGVFGEGAAMFGIETGTMGAPTANCFDGDYVTLNYLGVGVTLEFFNPNNPAASKVNNWVVN